MLWLEYIRTFWPVAVVTLPLVVAIGFMWLKTQFPTKSDLNAVERRLSEKIDAHDERLDIGSEKLAEFDKRIALVEVECKSVPSRQTLQSQLSELSQRMRGVEVGFEGFGRQLATTNDYLKIIVDKGFKE